MFYERVVPLNRDVHARLLMQAGGFTFASRTNSVPLLAVELPEAAPSFPILFTDIGQAQMFPIALLGLRAGQNLFVDPQGGWDPGCHVPAFVRRYPFALSADLTVCIDANFAGFSETIGDPLFTDAGENTPHLDRALAFLRTFHDEVERTHRFVAELQAADLLKPVSLAVASREAADYRIDGLFVVDAAKLAALEDAQVVQLFRSGVLARIHAHLASLGGLDALKQRDEARGTMGDISPSSATFAIVELKACVE